MEDAKVAAFMAAVIESTRWKAWLESRDPYPSESWAQEELQLQREHLHLHLAGNLLLALLHGLERFHAAWCPRRALQCQRRQELAEVCPSCKEFQHLEFELLQSEAWHPRG
ncbi:unnamed protein product [Cladocopium goreaui]|uniref:Uncharacterized protein n=1 Tax=Cladocopium goreaui TaxID=2562237 RepID=A0A9P1G7H7_9DINO|nr:unnamed protein product [Cladocopium goreaui]